MSLTHRKFVLSVGTLALTGTAAGTWMRLEAESLERVDRQIHLPGLRGPLRLVQLTDWHASPVVRFAFLRRAVEEALATKPDLVCLTGDFTTDGLRDWQPLRELLAELARAVPTFAVLGNHDGTPGAEDRLQATTLACLADAGVAVLENRSTIFTKNDVSLRLAGVGDFWRGPFDPAKAFSGVGGDEPTILLNHNPDARPALMPFPWHLCLCGHTHGGQINLPGLHGRFAPVRDRRFVAGTFDLGDRHLHVNRGLGSIGGVRWGARPELTVFELLPGVLA